MRPHLDARGRRRGDRRQSREQLSWAATLAGIAFGNAGVHLPHAMAYSVAGHGARASAARAIPQDQPLVPHGLSVIVNAPAASASPAAACAGASSRGGGAASAPTSRGAAAADAGALVAAALVALMQATGMPRTASAASATRERRSGARLARGAFVQKRLLGQRAARRRRAGAVGALRRRAEVLVMPSATPQHQRKDFPASPGDPDALDGQRRLRPRQQRRLLRVLRHRHQPLAHREGGLDIHGGAVIGLCVESRCRYLRAVAFPDALDAGLRVAHLGRSSVRYEIGDLPRRRRCRAQGRLRPRLRRPRHAQAGADPGGPARGAHGNTKLRDSSASVKVRRR